MTSLPRSSDSCTDRVTLAVPSLNPFKPAFALAETASLAVAALGLFAAWTGGPPERNRVGALRPLIEEGVDAFDLPLSIVWSPALSPSQPRIGPVLLVIAVAAAVVAWIPVLSRLRTVRMVVLLMSSGVAVAVVARAARASSLSSLNMGVLLVAAGFLVAAVFAGSFLRLPLLFTLAPVILGAAALCGWFLAGDPVA